MILVLGSGGFSKEISWKTASAPTMSGVVTRSVSPLPLFT
jgi:hypothetical protein